MRRSKATAVMQPGDALGHPALGGARCRAGQAGDDGLVSAPDEPQQWSRSRIRRSGMLGASSRPAECDGLEQRRQLDES
jgi:hypothetical protein